MQKRGVVATECRKRHVRATLNNYWRKSSAQRQGSRTGCVTCSKELQLMATAQGTSRSKAGLNLRQDAQSAWSPPQHSLVARKGQATAKVKNVYSG
jgi:hypothetical protein